MENKGNFSRALKKRVGRDIFKHQLIQENDNIAIALSGGKDSLGLLECLAETLIHIPYKIKLTAVHVNITNIPYKTDMEFLSEFCKTRDISFHQVEEKIKIDEEKLKKKGYCFICSWNRRKLLFNFCRENGYNKLAFGHHMDDALETFLMNMVYHGSISSLPWKLSMFNGKLEVIRPLLHIKEIELEKYAHANKYPREIKRCIHGDNTKRNTIKYFLGNLETIHPKAKINMFKSMNKIFPEYLPMNYEW